MDHLVAEEAAAHRAEEAHAPADLELFLLRRVEIEPARDERARRIADARDELAARAQRDFARLDDAFDLGLGAVARGRDRRQPRLVFVAQRQVQDEVLRPVDVELREPRRELRADAWPAGRGRSTLMRRRQVFVLQPSTRIASASTSAPFGSSLTPTAARAGYGSGK
jgi:hypothetical protein